MNIVIFIPSISGGGAERFSTLLSKGLLSRNHNINLLTLSPQVNEYELSNDVNRYILSTKKSFIKNAVLLHTYNKQKHIDICIAIGIYANLIAALSNFHSSTKIILLERNDPKHDLISRKSRLLRKLLYRFGDAFVFQTKDAKSFYSKRIQKRGVVIPNPVKDNLPLYTSKQKCEIVAVGRLMPQKNYILLLDAFSIVAQKHPEYRLRIFGKGKEEIVLKKHAQLMKIYDKVIFEGFSPTVHEQIKDSDIFVMSSDFEGMPNALLEAMCMGFPVISTDCPCGGPRMLINNKENGLLVPIGNKVAMANAILEYINNPTLKNKCATKAKESRTKYSLDNIIDLWCQFLDSLYSK